MQAIQQQGANTPAEALRQLPAFVGNTATENEVDFGNGDGSALVNLFALGPENTLTLINGRRTFAFEDINAIPLAALSRVEVLQHGASAVYGANAVAGAANFILLNGPGAKPYEGAEINLLYGNTTDRDARVLQGWMRGGIANKRLAVVVAAEFYDRAAIYSRDREISADADRRELGGTNQRSPTAPGRLSFRTNPAVAATNRASILIDQRENSPSGPSDYRAYNPNSTTDPFNFRAFTATQPAMEKQSYYAAARYKPFGETLQLYGDLLYSQRVYENVVAPANVLFDTRTASSSPYNPFLNPVPDTAAPNSLNDNQLRTIRYRTIRELGPRRSRFDHAYWRFGAGMNGNFALDDNAVLGALGYDAGFIHERVDNERVDSGDFFLSTLQAEVGAGNFNPFLGERAPLSGTIPTYTNGIATGTATYNNVAAARRAVFIGHSSIDERHYLIDGRIFGTLFPRLYQGGIIFALGSEYRENSRAEVPDRTPFRLPLGGQLPAISVPLPEYRQEVTSFFGELAIPLTTPLMQVPGVRSLTVGVAFRYEEFESFDLGYDKSATFDNGGSPRIAVRYEPVADLALRASWGKSFRPPDSQELFEPQRVTFPIFFGPFSPFGLQPAEGVIVGGNPDLRSETSDTYSVGVVATPRFLPGLTLSADLYQIYTRDVILPSEDFAELVLIANGRSGGRLFADHVIREEGTNLPIQVIALTSNVSKRLVNGLDVSAAYKVPTTNFGTFAVSAGYNYFFTWKTEALRSLGSTSFLGDYRDFDVPLAPGAIPYHKGFIRVEHEWKGLNVVATTNYISSFNDDPAFLTTEYLATRGEQRTVSDYITLDLQLSYEFRKTAEEPAAARDAKEQISPTAPAENDRSAFDRLLSGTTITVGVNNAFDRNPPTVLGAPSDNYDTSLYSIRNRFYYASVNRKF